MKHIELLKRCHELLRRVDTVTPEGRVSQDGDRLAKDINDYLNGLHTQPTQPQGQATDQDQRDHASAPDQTSLGGNLHLR